MLDAYAVDCMAISRLNSSCDSSCFDFIRPQVCFFYIDMMERYYTSDVSLEEGVLPGDGKLDMSYYWDTSKTESKQWVSFF